MVESKENDRGIEASNNKSWKAIVPRPSLSEVWMIEELSTKMYALNATGWNATMTSKEHVTDRPAEFEAMYTTLWGDPITVKWSPGRLVLTIAGDGSTRSYAWKEAVGYNISTGRAGRRKNIFKEKVNDQSVGNESRERKYKKRTSMLAQEAATPGW